MKRNMSLVILFFEIATIVVLHTIKIHRLGQPIEEMNSGTAVRHEHPEIKFQHYLLLKVK